MRDDYWERVQEAFCELTQLTGAARDAYLDGCDAAVRREIESLRGAERLSIPVGPDPPWADPAEVHRPSGTPLGKYVLERVVGSGGMGTVYLVTTMGAPAGSRKALKLVRRGLSTAPILRRFRQEQYILASLGAHPNIVQLEDAGADADGTPYFVTEYVDGAPIDVYCDRLALSIGARLELFVRICDAVQFAHQRLIVHRDIKPQNVLVQDGVPKLLDFGLAKLLVPTADEATLSLVSALHLMTPAYASPEQVRGDVVDVRTDVYSLGVLLHVLLTGTDPFPKDAECHVATLLAHRAAIGRASEAAVRGGDAAARAAARQATPDRLRRALSGDLDTIVRRALSYDPERRYPSVVQLSDDIRRHLQGRPVQARPDSIHYRAGKFATRHRYGVTVVGMALIALLVVFASTMIQSARVVRERDRAQLALARVEAANRFLIGMVTEADPRISPRGTPLTTEGMLDRIAGWLGTDAADAPEVHGTLLQQVANVYKQLGRYADAERLTLQALALRSRETPIAYAESLNALGDIRRYQGNVEAAVDPLEEALALRRRHLGETHHRVAETLNNLGLVRHAQRRYGDAEGLLRGALAIWERSGSPVNYGDHVVALAASNLGLTVRWQGRPVDAAALFRRALSLRRTTLPDGHPRIASSLLHLTLAHLDVRDYTAALATCQESLALRLRAFGEAHPDTLSVRAYCAYVHLLLDDRRTAAAEAARVTARAPAVAASRAALATATLVLTRLDLADGYEGRARARLMKARADTNTLTSSLDVALRADWDRLATRLGVP